MMYQVKLDEAKVRLLDLIEAAIRGEDVFILKDDHPVVQLVPLEPAKRHPQFGSAKGLVVMAEDFDAPLEDFSEYMP
jgi:antitoxin (DNA-binding transcriptional repressor) of toxin-antitoxin stability system